MFTDGRGKRGIDFRMGDNGGATLAFKFRCSCLQLDEIIGFYSCALLG